MKLILKLLVISTLTSCAVSGWLKRPILESKYRSQELSKFTYDKSLPEMIQVIDKYLNSFRETVPGYSESRDKFERNISSAGYYYKGQHYNGKAAELLIDLMTFTFQVKGADDIMKVDYYVVESTPTNVKILEQGILYDLKSITKDKTSVSIYPLVEYKAPNFDPEAEDKKEESFSFQVRELLSPKTAIDLDKKIKNAERSTIHEWLLLKHLRPKQAKTINAKVSKLVDQELAI